MLLSRILCFQQVYCGVMRAMMVEVKDDATHNWVQRELYSREGKNMCRNVCKCAVPKACDRIQP